MSTQTADPRQDIGGSWWLWLVTGILWIIISVVIIQFDDTSVRTIGVIVGIMLIVAGIQYLVIGSLADGWKWVWYVFGAVLLIAGVVALANPVATFVALADMLGFLFVLVGIVWIIEALGTRNANDLWWLSLIAGILMVFIGFEVGGQFFISQAYTLLVFAGIWALFRGITDIVLAFQIKKLGNMRFEV